MNFPKSLRVYVGLVTLCAVLAGCYDLDAWPTIHGDSRNSDTAPYPGITEIQKIWQRDFPGVIAAAATIGSRGQVYVTTTGNGTAGECHLYVIDLETGADKWCSSEVNRWVVGSSVLIDIDGNLYVGDDEAMHSFDRDGNLRWETDTVGAAISAQFTQNGKLIFITHIGQINILERADGSHVIPVYELLPGEIYTLGTGLNDCLFGGPTCPSANTLAFDQETWRIYNTLRPPGAAAAELQALRYERFQSSIVPLWTNSTLGGGTASSPVISADGSRIYINDNDGNFVALKSSNGKLIWDIDIGYAPAGSPSVTDSGRGVPAGKSDSRLLAVQDDGSTASIAWSRDTVVNLGVSVQVEDDVVYAFVRRPGTQFGVEMVSVDGLTGVEHDRLNIAPSLVATVGTGVASDGTVVVAGLLGGVAAFRQVPGDGAEVPGDDNGAAAGASINGETAATDTIEGVTPDQAACLLEGASDAGYDIKQRALSCVAGL